MSEIRSPEASRSVDERPWDVRIFELVDPGIDASLIDENLKRTPTERLARMQQMVRFLEDSRRDRNTAPR